MMWLDESDANWADHHASEDVTDDRRLAQPDRKHADDCGCDENQRDLGCETDIYHVCFTYVDLPLAV